MTAMATNQTNITDPKAYPIHDVPLDWIANRSSTMATARGTMYGSKTGVTMLRPSSADRTEIAGVIAPSP
jgi:hypothetical protein